MSPSDRPLRQGVVAVKGGWCPTGARPPPIRSCACPRQATGARAADGRRRVASTAGDGWRPSRPLMELNYSLRNLTASDGAGGVARSRLDPGMAAAAGPAAAAAPICNAPAPSTPALPARDGRRPRRTASPTPPPRPPPPDALCLWRLSVVPPDGGAALSAATAPWRAAPPLGWPAPAGPPHPAARRRWAFCRRPAVPPPGGHSPLLPQTRGGGLVCRTAGGDRPCR